MFLILSGFFCAEFQMGNNRKISIILIILLDCLFSDSVSQSLSKHLNQDISVTPSEKFTARIAVSQIITIYDECLKHFSPPIKHALYFSFKMYLLFISSYFYSYDSVYESTSIKSKSRFPYM